MPKGVSAIALACMVAVGAPARAGESVAAVLQRQTQELFDAVSNGSAAVWDRCVDEDVRYIDETGTVLTKKELLEGIKPLPEGISGRIQVTHFDVAVHGNVAIATHVEDENETFHGHKLHCQYRATDTWLRTAKGWRLISGQVLALRTDPPSIPIAAARREEYCGRYALTPTLGYEIRCHGDSLQGQQTGRKVEELRAEAPDVLFVPGRPRYRYIVLRGSDGRITGMAQRREAWDLVWERVN